MARRRRAGKGASSVVALVAVVAGLVWLLGQVLALLWRGLKAVVRRIQSRAATRRAHQPTMESVRPPVFTTPSQPLRRQAVSLGMPPMPVRPRASLVPGQWIPAGQLVRVHDYVIPGGMIYVGDVLPSVSGVAAEPALIVPSLQVASVRPNLAGKGVPCWPSYSCIDPCSRAAYLDWLASGRRLASAYIGYVFLFFYGLERRALFECQRSPESRAEISAIAAEVRALLAVYGRNRSFNDYASSFLDLCATILGEPAGGDDQSRPSFGVSLELAMLMRDRKPVPADVALRAALTVLDLGQYGLLAHCPDELDKLFRLRYAKRFPRGIPLKPLGQMDARYHPASSTFGGDLVFRVQELPDVRLREVAEAVRLTAQDCAAELSPYASRLARDVGARGSIEAVALLPRELADGFLGETERSLREWAGALTASGPALVKKTELRQRWPSRLPLELTRRSIVELSRGLEWLGFGMEPDIRFEGPSLEKCDSLVLFRLPESRVETASSDYVLGMLMARLGVVIAGADGAAVPQELATLTEMLEKKLSLDTAERSRLAAHTAWLAAEGTSLVGLKKKIEGLGPGHRQAIADIAATVALADGMITKEESARLEKVYQLLGLEPGRVYDDLHSLGASAADRRDSDLVTALPASPQRAGFAIPPGPVSSQEAAPVIALDMGRVAAKIAESTAVAAMLKDIFVDDESAPGPAAVAPAAQPGVAGLDAAHSGLLRHLADRATVDRAEWDGWCTGLKLLPDGAVDRLNEAALDLCGDSLLDGDDPLEVASSVLKEMLQ